MNGSDQQHNPKTMDDAALGALVRAALADERMPEGLAASALAFIHAKAGDTSPCEETLPAGARAPRLALASGQATAVPARILAAQPDDPAVQDAVPHQPAVSGKVVPFPARAARRRHSRRRFAQLLAACLVAAALMAGGVAYATETAQVQIDGGATVELGLNCWGRIVRVDASDDALDELLASLNITGMSCADALEALSASDELQDALSVDGPLLIVATSANASQLDATMSDCQAAAQGFGRGTMCAAADSETLAAASASGMGMARYHMYEQIAAIDPSVTLEDCQGLSMRELRDLLDQVEQAAADSTAGASGTDDGAASTDTATAAGETDATADDAGADADAASGHQGNGMGNGNGNGMGQGNGMGMGGNGMGRMCQDA